MKYGILLSITGDDTPEDVAAILTEIDKKLVGRDIVQETPKWYVIGLAEEAAIVDKQEVHTTVYVGYNQASPPKSLLQTSGYRQIAFNPPLTREKMMDRLRQLAIEDGCEKLWPLSTQQAATASDIQDLLIKFSSQP